MHTHWRSNSMETSRDLLGGRVIDRSQAGIDDWMSGMDMFVDIVLVALRLVS